MTIHVAYPDELLALASLNRDQFEQLAHESVLIRLYTLGVVSTGKAAEILGVSRREFLDLLGRYGVSEFDDDIDLEAAGRSFRSWRQRGSVAPPGVRSGQS